MSILKSIIITLLLIIVANSLDYLMVFSVSSNLAVYPHIVGLSNVLPYLLTYLLCFAYLRHNGKDALFERVSYVEIYKILILIPFLALGVRLIDLPFFHWKEISNIYLGTKFQIDSSTGYQFYFTKLYFYFSVIIMLPVLEEIFFRRYIFGGLLKRTSFMIALFTSSTLFALIHLGSPRNILPTFIFGVISALVYYRTRNIAYSILLHVFSNVIWLITVVFSKSYRDLIDAVNFGIAFWFMVFLGIIILAIGIIKMPIVTKGLLPTKSQFGDRL